MIFFISIITHEELHRQAALYFGYHPSQPKPMLDRFMIAITLPISELEAMTPLELFVISFVPTIFWMILAFIIGWPLLGKLSDDLTDLPTLFEESRIRHIITNLLSKRSFWLILVEFVVLSQALGLEGRPSDLKAFLRYINYEFFGISGKDISC